MMLLKKKRLRPNVRLRKNALSFVEEHPNNFFYGADISPTCAEMSTVNFFLNGLRGEVAHMNTLSMGMVRSGKSIQKVSALFPSRKNNQESDTSAKTKRGFTKTRNSISPILV